MAVEWTDEEETNLFKTIIRCRPIGIHKNFRMINLFLSVNSDASSSTQPRFSMSDIRKRLGALYDIDYIQAQEIEAQTTRQDSEDEDSLSTRSLRSTPFTLPYAEYRDVIESHARTGADSVPGTPPPPRDARSSPTQSIKTDSQVPDINSDDERAGTPNHTPAAAATTTTTSKRGRKRGPGTASKVTPRMKKAGSVNDSSIGTRTPGKDTDDEEGSVAGGGGGGVTTSTRKTRSAPSRKSTRKR